MSVADPGTGFLRNVLCWLLLLLLLGSGLWLRTVRSPQLSTGYQEGIFEARLAIFLRREANLTDHIFSLTRDQGIRGRYFPLPACGRRLDSIVMPEGDELHALWRRHARQHGLGTRYFFAGRLYSDYPGSRFWWQTMVHALARRLDIPGPANPGPVIALAYTPPCPLIEQLPWQALAEVIARPPGTIDQMEKGI